MENADFNRAMRRPMGCFSGALRLGIFAACYATFSPAAPSWATFAYVFAFSNDFVADLLFGVAPGYFAGGQLLGIAKWGGLLAMIAATLMA